MRTSLTPRPDSADATAFAAALGAAASAIAGVDEVGRGPLAGPVCAGAVLLDVMRLDPALRAEIDDSKRFTGPRGGARRDAVAAALAASPAVVIGMGWASVAEIAEINILQAAQRAMRRAAAALPQAPAGALVDGDRDPGLGLPTRLLVKGDGRSLQIAAASIVAKSARDAEMARLDALHPGYGWAVNAGYPTAAHRAALAAYGPSPHHRRGFKGVE